MDVLVVCDAGVERHDVVELPRLLDRQDAVIWVDIPACDEVAVEMLSAVFGFHRIAVHDCVERNHVSKVHIYPDHVFTVLHAPHRGQHGLARAQAGGAAAAQQSGSGPVGHVREVRSNTHSL
jgi:Mg2+ and Co2+ transporter CorA